VLESLAKIIQALAWPGLVLFGIWYLRPNILPLIQTVRQQIASGAALKFKDFEFKGKDLSEFEIMNGNSYAQEEASDEIRKIRNSYYKDSKNLMLVHRVRPTGEFHAVNGNLTFDISVYIIAHKSYGAINDVREVRYYFGEYFGKSTSKFGAEFVVRNGSENFAVKINAYGPSLCQARIIFHDNSEMTQERYLDFEGTGYRFNTSVNAADEDKKTKKLLK
jgi:hypothetical protein